MPVDLAVLNRILITLSGALAIFLGYRLFFVVPLDRDSKGAFRIKDIAEVSLVRVGPGVFFAFFGAALLAYSLHQQMQFEATIENYRVTPPTSGSNPTQNGSPTHQVGKVQSKIHETDTINVKPNCGGKHVLDRGCLPSPHI
jgi:hypothetical protein